MYRGIVSTHFNVFLRIGLICSIFLFIQGCQPPVEPKNATEPVHVETASSPAIDLTQVCAKIESDMQEISAERTTLALEQINQNLKICLPLLKHEQQNRLMQQSTAMYQRFLHVERNQEQQIAFEKFALEMAQHPTIQQSHLVALTLRDQYLLKHKGQAYVELIDLGENQLHYRRSPDYILRIFAPYLPKSEQAFIQILAEQNREPIIQTEHLRIDSDEILTRALTWQSYQHDYPNSPYHADAKFLMQQYAYYLFFGTEDEPVSEHYTDRPSIRADHLDTIKKLARMESSNLNHSAKLYLAFLDASTEQQNDFNRDTTPNLSQQQKLERYSNIFKPSHPKKKDCFKDAICI